MPSYSLRETDAPSASREVFARESAALRRARLAEAVRHLKPKLKRFYSAIYEKGLNIHQICHRFKLEEWEYEDRLKELETQLKALLSKS